MSEDVKNMSVIERVRAGHYNPTMEYPRQPRTPPILSKKVVDLSADEIASLLEVKATYEEEVRVYNEQRDLYRANNGGVKRDFQSDLEKEYDLVGHPKASKLYEIAYDMGHSAGMEEVAIFYCQLSELLVD